MKRDDTGHQPQQAGSSDSNARMTARRAGATSLAAGLVGTLVTLLALGFAGASGCGDTGESRDPG
ncbi:MAG: hypothetical protein ABI193_24560, partial [Minicystis sp.]